MNLDIHFCERGGIIWRRLILKILIVCCPAAAIFMVPSVNAQNLRFVVFAEGKHGYIDQNGSVVIPINLHQTYVNSFNEGLAKFSVVINPQQKTPYVDQRGKTRIRPEEKWGFINEDGKIAIPPQFDKVMDFSEGLAAIAFDTDETEPGCLGCDPKQVWGFIDKQGSAALRPQFHNVRSFSEGLAAVQNKEGRWGFVNKNGELVIPFLFENAHSFHESLAVANTRNKKTGFIDPKGNF